MAGVRIGAAGLRAAGADGYFDVDVNVEGPLALPPQACFLDGLQVATGATLGKRNLKWVEAPRLAVRVKNVHTGKTVVVRPTPAMMEWIASAKGSPLVRRTRIVPQPPLTRNMRQTIRTLWMPLRGESPRHRRVRF